VKKKVPVDPVVEVAAFFEKNGSVLMSAHDIASRTRLSIDEVNSALSALRQDGRVRIEEARLWTNIGLQPQLAVDTG